MPRPTTISGQMLGHSAVTPAAAMIAILASVSFRADKNAARVRLPATLRTLASNNAQVVLTTGPQNPINAKGAASGACGTVRKNLCPSVAMKASTGKAACRQSETDSRPRQRPKSRRAASTSMLMRRIFDEIDTVGEKRDSADRFVATMNSTTKKARFRAMTSHSVWLQSRIRAGTRLAHLAAAWSFKALRNSTCAASRAA